MKGRGLGLLLATVSIVSWSTNYLVGRYMASGGVDPLALSVARFALATPAAFALARFPRYRGGLAHLAALGLLGVAGFNIFLYSSLVYISAAAASLFVVLASPATQLLQAMLHREAPGRGALLGSALAILATLSWSLYTVLVRRVYNFYTPAEAMAWISLLGTLAMSPLAAYADYHALLTHTHAALVVYIALIPGAVAYTAWNTAVKLADPQSAASLLPLMPVITTALSAVLLHEGLSPLQTVGMALAIAGVYMALRVK
ncbi:DMT family transporter [Pyrobaculum sp.]|uniref:DMT family transporter n=1 Tax=Pyrobaculum sp. TaxID=2004705 RepID=UPI003D12670C